MTTNRRDWPLGVSGTIEKEILAEYQQAGIHRMELSYGEVDQWLELNFMQNARDYVKRAQAYDVTIHSVHLPFYQKNNCIDPTSSELEVKRHILSLQSELIRATGDAGIPIAVIHPSNEPYEEAERAIRIENCTEILAKLTAIAKEAGVTLALENLPRSCICRVKEEMQQILAAIPDLRVCFDSNHCLLQTNPDYIRAVGDKIVTLHISDYDFINERHLLPGEGMNYWENILTALEEVGYYGVFNYEITRKNLRTGRKISFAEIYENYVQLLQGAFR